MPTPENFKPELILPTEILHARSVARMLPLMDKLMDAPERRPLPDKAAFYWEKVASMLLGVAGVAACNGLMAQDLVASGSLQAMKGADAYTDKSLEEVVRLVDVMKAEIRSKRNTRDLRGATGPVGNEEAGRDPDV